MMHVARLCKRDPTYPWDVFEEWRGSLSLRSVELAIIDQCRYIDLVKDRNAGPAR